MRELIRASGENIAVSMSSERRVTTTYRSAAGQMMRKSQKEQISCVGVGWKS